MKYVLVPFRGFNGPIGVTNVKWQTPVAEAFMKAGRQMGYPTLANTNGFEQFGACIASTESGNTNS